jgi:hypothetical protein
MFKPDIILMGDYLKDNTTNKPDKPVTLISFVKHEESKDYKKCFCKVINESELDFEERWHNLSIRGYQKYMPVPDNSKIIFQSSTVWYLSRIEENGAVIISKDPP